jgi:hypothetical protein
MFFIILEISAVGTLLVCSCSNVLHCLLRQNTSLRIAIARFVETGGGGKFNIRRCIFLKAELNISDIILLRVSD